MLRYTLFPLLFWSIPLFAADFTGTWNTTYGVMNLEKAGDQIKGHYIMNGARCLIQGKVRGPKLEFKYIEPTQQGEGWFELKDGGQQISGLWHEDGKSVWMPWVGTRTANYQSTFDGVWDTTFGRLRLSENRDQVSGIYNYESGTSTIRGSKKGKKLNFTYQEAKASGEGWFELSETGLAFDGEWKERGGTQWKKWTGSRLLPISGRTWLVVIESNWERNLEEREFAFGNMLKVFFDRTPNVEVRRRTFTDAASLKKWLQEVSYFPEPTVVTIASHGEIDGLRANGMRVDADVIADGLQYASNVKALHFSSCLLMKERFGKEVQRQLRKFGIAATVSGYKNSVDWALSALFEMTFFDFVLSRGLQAPDAAKAALKFMPVAGEAKLNEPPIAPGGFEILN